MLLNCFWIVKNRKVVSSAHFVGGICNGGRLSLPKHVRFKDITRSRDAFEEVQIVSSFLVHYDDLKMLKQKLMRRLLTLKCNGVGRDVRFLRKT